jgi:hypothetical protein
MRVNKIILTVIPMILLLKGCIEPYYPDISNTQHSIVIEGTLTDKEGYHYIHVSRSVPYDSLENIPVGDCNVEIIDNSGNTVLFYESEPGFYEQWIDQEFLETGKKYKLRVTADGSVYESGYETMLACPPVDNVYYEIEKKETADPENPLYGIQFYTDLNIQSGDAKNYRWELEETWEYHSEYPIMIYWNGTEMIYLPVSTDTLFYCWESGSVHEIFTGTIKNITTNSLSGIPLNYVSNVTSRLKVKYSLLVKQYSISDTAYDYWSQLQKLSQETGGLYETQPPQIRGNIFNINDPDEVVLGNFNVSGLSEKRIFVSEKFNFFPVCYDCKPYYPEFGVVLGRLPVYFLKMPRDSRLWLANRECFDCTLLGGTTQKPDFWE